MPKASEKTCITTVQLPLDPQKYSLQKGGQRRKNLTMFKKILYQLSSQDPVSLLVHYLQTPKGKNMVSNHILLI
jgi:hypothetical protein